MASRSSLVATDPICGNCDILTLVIEKIGEQKDWNKKIHRELGRPNNSGETALYIACENDSHEIVKNLLTHYDDVVNSKDKKADNGKTPQQIAEEKGNKKTLEALSLFGNVEQNMWFRGEFWVD